MILHGLEVGTRERISAHNPLSTFSVLGVATVCETPHNKVPVMVSSHVAADNAPEWDALLVQITNILRMLLLLGFQGSITSRLQIFMSALSVFTRLSVRYTRNSIPLSI